MSYRKRRTDGIDETLHQKRWPTLRRHGCFGGFNKRDWDLKKKRCLERQFTCVPLPSIFCVDSHLHLRNTISTCPIFDGRSECKGVVENIKRVPDLTPPSQKKNRIFFLKIRNNKMTMNRYYPAPLSGNGNLVDFSLLPNLKEDEK